MKRLTVLAALPLCAILLVSFIPPKGWTPSGTAQKKYEAGLWKAGGYESQNCGVIRSSKNFYDLGEYGSMVQLVSSQKYLGKRIRLIGYMKTRGVEGWAGFYLRADKEGGDDTLTFNNMRNRRVSGNTTWRQYTIEIDVPLNTNRIALGANLHGKGIVWFDNLELEIIGESSLKSNEVICDTSIRRMPENLDFEQ